MPNVVLSVSFAYVSDFDCHKKIPFVLNWSNL